MYTDYRSSIIESLEEVFEAKNEAEISYYSDYQMNEVEYISRDGFMSFINGGFNVRKMVYLRDLDNGTEFDIPELDKKIEGYIKQAYHNAKETFEDKHEEFKGTEYNYHSLYDKGQGKLAEELSELEMDELGDYDITLEFTVQYYDEGNSHSDLDTEDSIYVSAVFNFDFDYHRQGCNEVLLFAETIPARNCSARLKELAGKAKTIFDHVRD